MRGVEGVENRIAGLGGARPLRVQMRLRPEIVALRRRKTLQRAIEVRCGDGAVALRPIAGAAARDLIDDIDRIAAAQEILCPAFAAVRRAGEIGSGLAAAMDHDDRVGMREFLRDLEFGVELPDHRRPFKRSIDLGRRQTDSRIWR